MRGVATVPSVLVHGLIIALFGVWLPWMRPSIFLEPVVTAAFCCLGVLFAGPASAQAFSAARPESTRAAAAGIFSAAAYGEMMTVLILAAGFGTVFVTHRYLFAPDVATLLAAGTLGLTASVAMASAGAWMALRFSPGAARRIMRVLFLLLLFAFFFRSASLPDLAGEGTLISLAIAVAAWFGLRRELGSK